MSRQTNLFTSSSNSRLCFLIQYQELEATEVPPLVAHTSTDFDLIAAHRELNSNSFAQGKLSRNRSCHPTLTDVCCTTPKAKSLSRPIDGDRQTAVKRETRKIPSFVILSHADLDEESNMLHHILGKQCEHVENGIEQSAGLGVAEGRRI